MGFLDKLLGGNTNKTQNVKQAEVLSEAKIRRLEQKLQGVYRNTAGQYIFTMETDNLLGRVLGISADDNNLYINCNGLRRRIPFRQGYRYFHFAVSRDFTRLECRVSKQTNYQMIGTIDFSLVPGGIEHDPFKPGGLKAIQGDEELFFFSVDNGKRSQICNKYVKENCTFEILPNEFDDDDTINIVAKENRRNQAKCGFMNYLIREASLNLYGIPVETILEVVERNSQYLTKKQAKTDPYPGGTSEICWKIFKQIKDKYGFTDNETAQYLSDTYIPKYDNIFDRIEEQTNIFNRYGQGWKEQYDQLFKRLVLEDGYKTKWVKELNLYKLVVSEYPDALFQYTAPFLGAQSLDVYIPSLNVGLEYQGIQHYEPVEYFGGQDKYEENVERDARKRSKCAENGVKLIEWKYTDPITKVLLKKKMSEVMSI